MVFVKLLHLFEVILKPMTEQFYTPESITMTNVPWNGVRNTNVECNFQQYVSYMVNHSFIGGESWITI